MNTAILFLALVPLPQEGAAQDTNSSAHVEELRGRIHDMRMNLILGGDKVRQAEGQAIDFYQQKMEVVDQRLDSLSADLSEKRATYDVTLEDALGARSSEARAKSMQRALALRSEIHALEQEAQDLEANRKNIGRMVSAVEARGREREALAARIETAGGFEDALGLPMAGIGLAPDISIQEASSPFDDQVFVRELWQRDPRGAARILFEADPARYVQWRTPLQPPGAALRKAMTFPLPDPPGMR